MWCAQVARRYSENLNLFKLLLSGIKVREEAGGLDLFVWCRPAVTSRRSAGRWPAARAHADGHTPRLPTRRRGRSACGRLFDRIADDLLDAIISLIC